MVLSQKLSVLNMFSLIWKPLLSLFLLDLVVTFLYVGMGWTWLAPSSMPLPLLGTGLTVFLAFRNSTAYARWWEARTLWGAVTNHSRSFVRAVSTFLAQPEAEALRVKLIMYQIAWVHALRCNLHRTDPMASLERLLEPKEIEQVHKTNNIVFALHMEIAFLLSEASKDGMLGPIELSALNTTLNELSNAQGGLERIRNTPMPRQYSWYPRLFVSVYCTTLPFGIVPDLLWATPLGSTVIGFLFLALDAAGSELESPFDRSVHDIPMTTITRNIEIDLREALDLEHAMLPTKTILGISL